MKGTLQPRLLFVDLVILHLRFDAGWGCGHIGGNIVNGPYQNEDFFIYISNIFSNVPFNIVAGKPETKLKIISSLHGAHSFCPYIFTEVLSWPPD